MATKKPIKKKDEEVVITNPTNGEVTETSTEVTENVEKTADIPAEIKESVKAKESTEVEAEVTANPNLVMESDRYTEKPNVRIKTIKDYHCNVAGTMYYFEKGKCYNVPSNIKMVLNKAGVLAVL